MEARKGGSWRTEGRRARGWLAFGGGGGLAVLAVFIAMAPIASAAPVRFGAPFMSGTPVHTLASSSFGSGASFLVVGAPVFSMATGLVTENLMATAVAGGNFQPNLARVAGTVGIDGVAYTPTASGPYAVAAHWTVFAQGKLSLAAPLRGFAAGIASVTVRATTYLTETSTGMIVPGSTGTLMVFQKTLSAGVVGLAIGPLSVSVRTPTVVLQGGTAYYLTALLSIEVVASTAGAPPSGTTALAQVSLAAPSALGYLQVT